MADVEHGSDPAQEPKQRAYRQVDFAGNDHEHHAAGQDARNGHLTHQIGQIARRDEAALGFPAEEGPDQGNGEQEREDLVLREQLLEFIVVHFAC